jgi:hypothetical protein
VIDIVEQVERDLLVAHGRAFRAPRRWRHRARVIGVVAATLIVAVPAAAATSGWDPFADAPERKLPAPTVSSLPPAASLTAQLAVLRRSPEPADRSDLARDAVRSFDNDVRVVQLDSVRVLSPTAVLVPVESSEPRGPAGTAPNDRELSSVCLYIADTDGTSGSSCHTARDIARGEALMTQSAVISGLVPDGVARVRLTARDSQVSTEVHDNYFSVNFPAARISPGDPGSGARADGAEWFDARGKKLEAFDYTKPPSGPVR